MVHLETNYVMFEDLPSEEKQNNAAEVVGVTLSGDLIILVSFMLSNATSCINFLGVACSF